MEKAPDLRIVLLISEKPRKPKGDGRTIHVDSMDAAIDAIQEKHAKMVALKKTHPYTRKKIMRAVIHLK